MRPSPEQIARLLRLMQSRLDAPGTTPRQLLFASLVKGALEELDERRAEDSARLEELKQLRASIAAMSEEIESLRGNAITIPLLGEVR